MFEENTEKKARKRVDRLLEWERRRHAIKTRKLAWVNKCPSRDKRGVQPG